jgi:NitT/TauT family transport system permease protein
MKISKKILSAMGWGVALLALWQLVAWLLADVFRDPLAAKRLPYLQAFWQPDMAYLLGQAGITLKYAAGGFLIGGTVGAALALLMRLSHLVERMIQPYLLLSQMIPVLGLAPIIFGLCKSLEAARVVIAAYITFFPVSISLLSGLRSVPEAQLQMMRACAASTWQLYRKLLIPFSVPYLFSGLKIAAPVAVGAAILVDTLSSKNGIGYVIVLTLYGGGTTGQFWPALAIAALMGLFGSLAVSLVERLVLRLMGGRGW